MSYFGSFFLCLTSYVTPRTAHIAIRTLFLLLCLSFTLQTETAAQTNLPIIEGESFRFVRVKYESNSSGRRGWRRNGIWATDWPAADNNLHQAIERTTNIPLAGTPLVLTLKDKEIFQYPVLYLTEPGYWYIDDEEVENLRKYIDRGGFLMLDDFHDYGDGQTGPEWDNMYANMKRVFPEREPVELTAAHPIWSIFYDIDPDAALSTKWQSGEVPWLDADDDTYYGIFDEHGRMGVVICYNQDIGDGWEWPGRNMGDASTISFQMAINMIMYALSH